MSIQAVVEALVAGRPLIDGALESAFGTIMDGGATEAQSAALLVALRMQGESAADLIAAARALRARAERVEAPVAGAVDTCGTGGARLSTFNISTTAAFVVSGAGVPVAKHGNRAASSRSGSFDVLEALGIRIDLPISEGVELLAEVGIAPLFARTAHPAMRYLAKVRSELGIRTLMNGLGPLLNPLGVKRQVVGVYSPALIAPLSEALRELGAESALVVHGRDGLDELTVTAPSDAMRLADGALTPLVIDPSDHGFALAQPADLEGGDAVENAAMLRAILDGERGSRRDVVVLNAGAAVWTAGAAPDLAGGVALAKESIDSGAARGRLEALVSASKRRGEKYDA